MHAVTPYLLKSYDKYNKDTKKRDYFSLSNVRNKDLLELIHKFMQSKSSTVFDFPEQKRVYKFTDIKYDIKNRTLTAFLIAGFYGVKSDILDKTTGDLTFPKSEDDAEVLKHFVLFTIPSGKTEGIALFHKSRGVGVKSLFSDLFLPFFRTQCNSILQINPYGHTDAITDWASNARVTELKVSGYVGSSDVASNLAVLGECNTEFSIFPKAKKRGVKASFGALSNYLNLNKNPSTKKIVTYLEGQGSKVRTVAELNGSSRTFEVGTNSKGVVCDIPFAEEGNNDVKLSGGQPIYSSIKLWAMILTNDILIGVYGKKKAFQIKVPKN
jgi:hypothetical protein